jgi:hypothetical protein
MKIEICFSVLVESNLCCKIIIQRPHLDELIPVQAKGHCDRLAQNQFNWFLGRIFIELKQK